MSIKPLSKEFLLARVKCCKNSCLNCPFKKENMNIAICLIIKNENEYLYEWLEHYRGLGIKDFIIYDNNSKFSVKSYLGGRLNLDVKVIEWKDNLHGSQSRAYLDCCRNNTNYDYIGFFDMDEFIILTKEKSIQEFLEKKKKEFGNFDGFGIYWRIYGQPYPYFETRKSYTEYKQYSLNPHIKSFVNPTSVISFPDPHKAQLKEDCLYIDELGENITSPLGEHTSVEIYVKHIFTRSENEFKNKIERGDANLRVKNRTWEDFYTYNDACLLIDEECVKKEFDKPDKVENDCWFVKIKK